MTIHTSIAELQAELKSLAHNTSIGFVPTMGALHNGHISLVEKCKKENDICVLSIFVNPTQFNNPMDLEKYPRTLESDIALLKEAGCDVVFIPNASEVYSQKDLKETFEFNFNGLDKVMEGKFRPGHFNGVVQIVSKLFTIVDPTNSYFGEKDFQQVAIIRHMSKELGFRTNIVSCPIIREPDGLAMSSRNMLLSESDRKKAARISEVLFESRNFVPALSVQELKEMVVSTINQTDVLDVEYFEIVDGYSLQSVKKWDDAKYIVGCITVFCGAVRLIDNIQYK